MFKGNNSLSIKELKEIVDEHLLLQHYLGISKLPCVINSPLREDNKPSFGLYENGRRIFWVDFATKEKGGLYDLLSLKWHCPLSEVLTIIHKDIRNLKLFNKISTTYHKTYKQTNNELKCQVREWKDYDIDYWKSFGISLKWLRYAEIYPISYKIVYKDGKQYAFKADKYAYAFVEHKENNTTIKIYQPFNKAGYKWSNKHDGSVISLWSKIPEKGEKLCICSSVKDALCLWSNCGIPCISLQGEGYKISDTALNVLKNRYNEIFVIFDNDESGLKDGIKFSKETGFTNVIIPFFKGGKDVSDYYKIMGEKIFIDTFNSLLKNKNLPF